MYVILYECFSREKKLSLFSIQVCSHIQCMYLTPNEQAGVINGRFKFGGWRKLNDFWKKNGREIVLKKVIMLSLKYYN